MFGWLKKSPARKLRDAYEAKLKEARDEQRNGDVRRAAELTAEAEVIGKRMDELESSKS